MPEHHDGKVDAEIVSKITAAEKSITHEAANVVAGGPTAMAQKHFDENIDSKVLQDIAEGENKITSENCPIAGGPIVIFHSELSKSRMRKVTWKHPYASSEAYDMTEIEENLYPLRSAHE